MKIADVRRNAFSMPPAALELFQHARAPVVALPVREVVLGVHILADLTLGLGRVVHDYLAD